MHCLSLFILIIFQKVVAEVYLFEIFVHVWKNANSTLVRQSVILENNFICLLKLYSISYGLSLHVADWVIVEVDLSISSLVVCQSGGQRNYG